ncbi:MAG: hypothetical protein HZC02_04915 [Candidatus Levybacteria bacterium]|nr:hypothetical protein [Candidatus Levybacteria bacterium]
MKIIVAHKSPDWDAIGSVWLLKNHLPGWQDATVVFVSAGKLFERCKGYNHDDPADPIEKIGEDEIIHVDTGLGPLDHHQTSDLHVCAASKTWDYVLSMIEKSGNEMKEEKKEAIGRVVGVITEDDHFREVFWGEPLADYHEFSLIGVLDGLKSFKPDQDDYFVKFGMEALDAVTHAFESRIWAEKEIQENGTEFSLKKGKAIAFVSINDNVIKLAQKMGYLLVVRKDPRHGYVRIKVRPSSSEKDDLDLTLAYEKLRKIDPEATWFLHVSKKMLLNGTSKNPDMVPSHMTLEQIVDVLKSIY